MPKRPTGRMLRERTPIEYHPEYGLYVKREDLACPPPGPPFSKTRGVFAHLQKRPERVIGVLDTYHSQAGHAVARACQILGKSCINFWPKYKGDSEGLREPQLRAAELGATPFSLQAGRSCILYHRAKKLLAETWKDSYMMPNALKLDESVEETAKEVERLSTDFDVVIIPASSGTIAAGVVRGFERLGKSPEFVVHLGYSRSMDEVARYIHTKAGCQPPLTVIDEGYAYKDKARPGTTPPWPCNEYYDLKAFRWWLAYRDWFDGKTVLFWNIG